MKDVCYKNISCCGCPEVDTCDRVKHEELFIKLFTRYGRYKEDITEKTNHFYVQHPKKMYKQSEIVKAFSHTDDYIEELEIYIAMLKAYKIELGKRYNELETTPIKKKIRLERYKKYQGNVFYYIIFYDVYLTDGHQEETKRITFTGKERLKAMEEFEKICNKNKNAIIEKDIVKKSWER